MWIFDSYYKGFVELWSRGRGLERINAAYPPSFYMHLKDSHAHWEMIEGLESRYKVEECSFNTIFGSFQGHKIYASRKVAENIEKQTRYTAELYSVDIRQDQDIWLRKTSSPESSFSPDLSPLDKVEILVLDPQNIRVEFSQDRSISGISYLRGTTSNLSTRLSSMSTTSNRRLPHSK